MLKTNKMDDILAREKLAGEKILILGAKGLLGQELVKVFAPCSAEENLFSLTAWDKDDLDLTDLVATDEHDEHDEHNERAKVARDKILDLKPTIIINATGYTNVDGAESDIETANLINGEVVGELARLARKLDALMIHFSTEYVFDGTAAGGYNEDAATNPLNAYARSKLLGEQLLVANCEKYYLIRLSWLFGARGANFVDTMLKLAREKGRLKIVSDQISKPTYAPDLARAVADLLTDAPAYGIYHLPNEGATSKYELIREAVKLAGIEVEITPCGSDEFPTPARRPLDAHLNNTKRPRLRPWQEALAEYLKTRESTTADVAKNNFLN